MELRENIQFLKGVGPAKARALGGLGIVTGWDLLTHYPRRYEDRTKITPIAGLSDGEFQTVLGQVVKIGESLPRRGMHILKVLVNDGSGILELSWFNQKYLKTKFSVGKRLSASGKVKKTYHCFSMNHPEFEFLAEEEQLEKMLLPIYPATETVNQKMLRSLVKQVLETMDIEEILPKEILRAYKLMERKFAFRSIHFPVAEEDLQDARYRLAFEELFFIQAALLLMKLETRQRKTGIKHLMDSDLSKACIKRLPFALTGDQQKALREIKRDMECDIPMQRLLQGDVGSGKTVIAMLALVKTVENGFQGIFMAPTEILAEQHYQSLMELLGPLHISIGLLTGSLSKKKRDILLTQIKDGTVQIVIGTHAILQEDVQFQSVGLVVTDEQHRFGVRQRAVLEAKGGAPDVLVMTATPIPRTMSLTVYGDLDVSVIKELPPGRKPIRTFVRSLAKRPLVYQFVLDEIKRGRQAYVVCPLIEPSENIAAVSAAEVFEELQEGIFRGVSCGLVHGNLAKKEKDEVMRAFYAGDIRLLVSTTVIEVGVNVPNASIMVIEGADRFGLSQLHQLRGRIGRGPYHSYCVLLTNSRTEKTVERLAIMEKTHDGFLLAEEDLKLRGPGQFFGVRQHGVPDLKIADIFMDVDILLKARRAAMDILSSAENQTWLKRILKKEYSFQWENLFHH